MNNIEILSILGGIFELLQLFFLARKNKIGFIFGIFGNIFWLTYASISLSAYGVFLICTVALFLNFNGYRMWKNK